MKYSLPALLACALLGSAQAATIQNEALQASVAEQTGAFTLRSRTSGRVLLDHVLLAGAGGKVETRELKSTTWGRGQAMEITRVDGSRDRVVLYEGLPFAFVQPVFFNEGAAVTNIRTAVTLGGAVLPDQPAAALKAWGTAGLTAVDKHPGSYVFLALADPATRGGLVAAWLTGDRGSGIVFSGLDGDRATLRAQIDYGRLLVGPGETAEGEILALGGFEDVRLGLEKWADLVAKHNKIKLPAQLDGYCTWYSSPHGGAADEKSIVELAEFAAKELKPFGFGFVQIDDYWQEGKRRNGPAKVFLQHSPTGPYPNGMKGPAEKITALGLTAGLWYMPFAGDHDDPWFADKLDWFAKAADGKPYHTPWGGTALDQTHPAVQAYVSEVAHKIAKEWGYKYFKMDGMWMGTATKQIYVNNGYRADDVLGEPAVHDPKQTPIEAYRAGLRRIRAAAGDDVFILGCCVSQNMRSFGGTFGLVDAMRIGPDNGGSWESIKVGPWHSANRYFLHGRVWYNDPDPCYIRASMPYEQAQAICSWVGLSGMLQASSDWLPQSAPDRLNLLKRILPNHGRTARPVDILEREMANLWLVSDYRGTAPVHLVGAFNWDAGQPLKIEYPMGKLGLDAATTYVGFDFWADQFVPPFSGALRADVPAAACQILALRPAASHPQLISTSRHITQGLVDVLEEKWDAKSGVLSGRSKVVAGDRYELRVVVPTGEASWVLATSEIPGQAAKATQAGPQVRVAFTPAAGGEVAWRLLFKRGAVAEPVAAKPAGLTATSSYRRVRLSWTPDDALAYRVTRNDGATWQVTKAELTDSTLAAGARATYQVSARGWSDRWSEAAEVTAETPAQLVAPPVPPAPTVKLGDLKLVADKTGWGDTKVNRSVEGKPLTVGGKVYEQGIGTHANALQVYDIPAGMTRFVATVGLDDEQKHDPRASVVAKLYGDVKEMGEKPELLAESPVLSDGSIRFWHIQATLSPRHRQVRLVIEDAGDGINADHADWVNAGFLKP